MRLFSYLSGNTFHLGVQVGERGNDLNRADPNIPDNMSGFLEGGEPAMGLARDTVAKLKKEGSAIPLTTFEFAAPVPNPTSCRDAYAFRQHVEMARRNKWGWLKPGDTVEMEVTGLGRLINTVSLENAP